MNRPPHHDPSAAPDDRRWQQVLARDGAAEGTFVYAVVTTGIYCRPTCPSRRPRRENVRFFANGEDAQNAGFRACKRCRPADDSTGQRDRELVVAACRQIESSDTEPSLDALAEAAGLSRTHFHRLFKSVLGVTPKGYARTQREKRVKQRLATASTVTDAMHDSGYGSSSRFYAQSEEMLGMSPSKFVRGGGGEVIRFAVGQCSLGAVLIAATEIGVCDISLGDDAGDLLDALQRRFRDAKLVGDDIAFQNHVAAVVGFIESPGNPIDIPLDIRGTAFQQKVWKALRGTRPGDVMSYSQLAERIGAPRAVRAVASACGANTLAMAIPCHRVVRRDGSPSGYRWGIDRKVEMLSREQALGDG